MISIDQQISEFENLHQEKISLLRKNKELYESFLRAVAGLKADAGFNYSLGYVVVSMAGNKQDLGQLMRALYSIGLRPDTKPEEKSTEWNTHWRRHEKEEIDIFSMFTSTVCVMRQIGTETKEVPIYEMVCE